MIEIKNKRVLVVVSHPDDEVLGMGASINRLVKDLNCELKVVILGEGLTSRDDSRDPARRSEELQTHRKNIEEAQKLLGYQQLAIYQLPDNRFDSIDLLEIVKIVELEKKIFKPDLIFTHFGNDLNIDHKRTFEAVVTASRPIEGETVKALFSFHIPSATDWSFSSRDVFLHQVAISVSQENLEAKLRAMEKYEYERRPFPHPRSSEALKSLASYIGSIHGVNLAETFMCSRIIFS